MIHAKLNVHGIEGNFGNGEGRCQITTGIDRQQRVDSVIQTDIEASSVDLSDVVGVFRRLPDLFPAWASLRSNTVWDSRLALIHFALRWIPLGSIPFHGKIFQSRLKFFGLEFEPITLGTILHGELI
jgi:hypothetical protein